MVSESFRQTVSQRVDRQLDVILEAVLLAALPPLTKIIGRFTPNLLAPLFQLAKMPRESIYFQLVVYFGEISAICASFGSHLN